MRRCYHEGGRSVIEQARELVDFSSRHLEASIGLARFLRALKLPAAECYLESRKLFIVPAPQHLEPDLMYREA
jgi:hypothetical protein